MGGMRCDRRLLELSIDDWEFIYTAVEAGWTTPMIVREVDADWAAVFIVAREARRELGIEAFRKSRRIREARARAEK